MRLGWFWLSIAAVFASHTVVDLSQPFSRASGYNNHPVADALASARDARVLGYVLVNSEGELLAEYYRSGRIASDVSSVHAVTKSWIAVLVCMLVEAGQLSLSTTLGEVWPGHE